MARQSFTASWMFPFLLHVCVFLPAGWYLYSRGYVDCLLVTPQACVHSALYVSLDHTFQFRYPQDYPLSFRTQKELAADWGFETGAEVVNFSRDFNLDAGGDRLGSIVVSSSTNYHNIEDYINSQRQNYDNRTRLDAVRIGNIRWVCSTEETQVISLDAANYNCVTVHSGRLYTIFFSYDPYYHKQPLTYYRRQRKLILSTFSFI